MRTYTTRLYAIMHPSPALIASQLDPEAFGLHYLSGSIRHYTGKIIFAEIDVSFRNPYFHIDDALKSVVPHEDGSPKSTKFISVYRVIEHLDFSLISSLYLTTPEGMVLRLDKKDTVETREKDMLRIFVEIAPVRMLVLTRLNFLEFGKAITDTAIFRSVPAALYTQLEFDASAFLDDLEHNPLLPTPVPSVHPSKLRDAIHEMQSSVNKKTKGLLLDSSFNSIPYKLVRHGFMFFRSGEHKFFALPSKEEIAKNNFKFWKAM